MITFTGSACGAPTTDVAGLGPRAFAMGWMRFGVPALTTSEGTGATAFEGVMAKRMTAERFWERVDVRGPDECWEWKGSRRPMGYGAACFAGKYVAASRLAWILTARITPPRHLMACHTCNNPPCCNPNHIYLGTAQDNARDTVRSNRHASTRKTHCPLGHPYEGRNVYIRKSDNSRFCRKCNAGWFRLKRKKIALLEANNAK